MTEATGSRRLAVPPEKSARPQRIDDESARTTASIGRKAAPGSVRWGFYPSCMARQPSRIDLLELDIDLRLADLWREAGEVAEWNIEIVAAFMRAAYGKGYCDSLTEDSPGALCLEHGYRVPGRGAPQRAREA